DGFVGMWATLERQIASGAGLLKPAVTVFPLLVVVLFVIAEVLGGMPDALRKVAISSENIGNVQWKYVVLIVVLSAAGAAQMLMDRAKGPGSARTAVLVPKTTPGA